MTTNKAAIIVGVLIILVLGVWGFLNLSPFLSGLFTRTAGTVTVNGQEFKVQVADPPETRENGLSR